MWSIVTGVTGQPAVGETRLQSSGWDSWEQLNFKMKAKAFSQTHCKVKNGYKRCQICTVISKMCIVKRYDPKWRSHGELSPCVQLHRNSLRLLFVFITACTFIVMLSLNISSKYQQKKRKGCNWLVLPSTQQQTDNVSDRLMQEYKKN